MRTANSLRRGLGGAVVAAAALASLSLAGCTVSGPPTLGDTGSVGQPQAAAPPAGTVTAGSPPATPPVSSPQAAPGQGLASSVKVAMLLPLSAPPHVAAVAKGMKQAGELALFELDNPAVQLVVKDDKGTPDGARAAAEEAIREGAELILGPLLSGSVAAAAPPARAAGIPIVAFSNDPHAAGNGVYLLSFLARPEIERVVAHAVAQSRRRFAALLPAGPYGQQLEEALQAAISRHGGMLVAREAAASEASGLVEPIQRLAEAIKSAEAGGAAIEALFVPGGHEAMAAVAPLLVTNGVDSGQVKLVGTGGWDLPAVVQEAALGGAWYAGPDPRGWRAFAARFVKTYGVPPPRLSTLAYDAVGVAAALSTGAPRARYTTAMLARPAGFNGVDGPFRLLPGGLAERALAVLEVKSLGVDVVDPAPGALGATQLTSAAPSD